MTELNLIQKQQNEKDEIKSLNIPKEKLNLMNMSEEEEIVLKILKNYNNKKYYELSDTQLSIVLNLIEKQQEEIEHLKSLNQHQSKDITKAVNYTFELNKEIEKKDKRISDLEYALLYMTMQFADRSHKNGCEYAISTMGLSSLEIAFNELDLDDPTPIKIASQKFDKLQKQYFEKKVED